MTQPRAALRSYLAAVLAATLLLIPFAQVPRASAADGSLVVAAVRVLEEDYVDPVQPTALLNAAVAALRKATNEGPDQLPDVASGTPEPVADGQFVSEFAKAAQGQAMPETQLAYTTTQAMLLSLHDSHTYFMDPKTYQESRQQLFGNPTFTGIGVLITSQKDSTGTAWVFVENVFPDSPAAQAGIKRFDRIVSVDGHSLVNKTAEDASQLIRGPAGTVANITVQRGTQTTQISVTRAPIKEIRVEANFIAPGVAYLKIFEFTQGTGRNLREAIQGLQAQGQIHSVILDLRGNPGGLITEAASVGGIFMPGNTVLSRIHERGQAPSTLVTSGVPLLLNEPMAVIVDGASASASEILTGAFKDYQRATVVGDKTAGALGGSVTVALPDGGMSVTVERILTPKNAQVEAVGITPDVPVKYTAEDMERGQDPQLAAALHAVGTAWLWFARAWRAA
jgi:carboxyl-terminal processing protease